MDRLLPKLEYPKEVVLWEWQITKIPSPLLSPATVSLGQMESWWAMLVDLG